MEWVDFSWYDSDKRESSWNQKYSESILVDPNHTDSNQINPENSTNIGFILYLSNHMESVDSIWCDPDQRELSRNIFYSNLYSSRCDSNLQNFCAQPFQL